MSGTDTLLDVRSASKRFGPTQALRDVSFSLGRGEILGLAGENGSGKSTMVKILCGIHRRDAGEIWYDGNRFEPHDPGTAEKAGISVFHQEIPVCKNMSVAANLFLSSHIPTRLGMPDWRFMYGETVRLFHELLNESIDPAQPMKECTVAERQMVLLVKALSQNARLIVLDEPTTALTPGEVLRMFEIINQLKLKGISFIFISHMMEEVIELCDHVVVLRDGEKVGDLPRGTFDRKDLAALIAGRTLEDQLIDRKISSEVAFEIRDYRIKPSYDPIDVTIRRGEIVGVAGLAGSGRSELLQSLFGVVPNHSGTTVLNGTAVRIDSPLDAMRVGIGYLPEDRKTQGLFYTQDLMYNIGYAARRRWNHRGIQQSKALKALAERYSKKINIKSGGIRVPISSLSGGNQQKVLLARWLMLEPTVLMMNEPTRGIDVGAKEEICKIILEMSDEGYSFIIASSELEELILLSDRLIVMNRGKVSAVLERGEITKEKIVDASA